MGFRFRSLQQALSGMADSAEKLQAKLVQLATLPDAKLRQAQARVAARMESELRAIIVATFQAAGLKSRSGALLRALRSGRVVPVKTGIWVELPPGLPRDVYIRAAVFKFGAVRQPLTKAAGSTYFDPISRTTRKRKFAAGELGDKAKATLKGALFAGQAKARGKYNNADLGRVSVVAPREGFLKFSPAQIKRLNTLQLQLVREELAAMGVTV